MTHTNNNQLNSSQFLELQDFIYQKSGMYFPFSRKHYIEQKVMKRIAALQYDSFSCYLNILKGERKQSEIFNLFNEITVNETFFFRDLPQLEVLEKHIFPEAQSRGKKHLNILSAGCSSGEEPYTIAIIMREKFPQLSYNIMGVDISDLAVAKANRGEYTQYAVRFVPKAYLKKYFSLTKQGSYKFHDYFKTNIKLETLNLMELDTAQVNVLSFDVIFCRYVLIYFDRESKQEVINRFHDKIAANGYLILGNSESLFSVANNFKMLHFPSAILYNKN